MERQMFTDTKQVLSVVALIVATGIATVEATRTPAQADPLLFGHPDYAAMRIAQSFDAAAAMPAMTAVSLASPKGDLMPTGCAGPLDPTFQAECLDSAYEVASDSDTVIETRIGNTSILTRMERFTVAGY
jgi:hypothetical protein